MEIKNVYREQCCSGSLSTELFCKTLTGKKHPTYSGYSELVGRNGQLECMNGEHHGIEGWEE
jgi:hypothetical protein